MTNEHANELKVGIVVLFCLGLGIAVAMSLSDWRSWFEPKVTLTFKVPYESGIGGIKAGWPVTIGGVAVGSVQDISLRTEPRDPLDVPEEPSPDQEVQPPPVLDSGQRTYSYFTFSVPSKYMLRTDCKLTPASQPIGGAGELRITCLGQGELLQDGQEVFRKDLDQSGIGEMMARAREMMDKVVKVIDTAQAAMEKVGKITDDLKDVSGKARETVNTAKPKLEVMVDNFQTASANFKDLSAKAKETVSLTKPQLEKIISNVRTASAEMKEGMREIRWNPWRLLHNPTDRELRTQNLLAAARAFSTGASDIDSSVGKLEGLLEAKGDEVTSEDPDVQQMLTELRATMVKFNEAADTFFKRLGKAK